MIFYVATERFSATMRYYVDHYREELGRVVSVLSYEELFFEGAGPIGHYIFTDFDRLTRYEIECAAAFAAALQKAAPTARILNHPMKVLERYPLLLALYKEGINDFTATRLEAGERPACYPVFIRAEDGYAGPETGLLNNDEEFDSALDDLMCRNLPRRGRIAIGFANEPAPDGRFHKYGAFKIGDRIVPHDLMFGWNWVVKMRFAHGGDDASYDEVYSASEEGVARELRYIVGNPHEAVLRRAFAIAGIEYGRADYGVVGGRVQIYEINTNPHLTSDQPDDGREERLAIVQQGTLEAIKVIDTLAASAGRVYFNAPRPRAHNLHWPRKRLAASLVRRTFGRLLRRQAKPGKRESP